MNDIIKIFSNYGIIQKDIDESKDMASMFIKLKDGHAFRILLNKDDGFLTFTITFNEAYVFSGEDCIETFKENVNKFLNESRTNI